MLLLAHMLLKRINPYLHWKGREPFLKHVNLVLQEWVLSLSVHFLLKYFADHVSLHIFRSQACHSSFLGKYAKMRIRIVSLHYLNNQESHQNLLLLYQMIGNTLAFSLDFRLLLDTRLKFRPPPPILVPTLVGGLVCTFAIIVARF